MTPSASLTAFTMNQNWSGSSFPTPLNTKNFISLAILNCCGGGGGVSEDGGEDGETSCGVGESVMREIRCLIKLIALLGETFVNSSSLCCEGEIKGLDSNSVLPTYP